MASSEQKRELLLFMLSNSSWVDGKLEVEMFEAFDLMLKLTETTVQNENEADENGLVNIISVDCWSQGTGFGAERHPDASGRTPDP